MPIYASQFHPEKVAFEWDTEEEIPHEFDAIRLEQWLGNFFVNETRQNHNQFPNETFAALFTIDNYNTTILSDAAFQTIYFFPNMNYSALDGTKWEPNTNPTTMDFVQLRMDQEEAAAITPPDL